MISITELKKTIEVSKRCHESFLRRSEELVLRYEKGKPICSNSKYKYTLSEGILRGRLCGDIENPMPDINDDFMILTRAGYLSHWLAGIPFKERNPEYPCKIEWWPNSKLRSMSWENPWLQISYYYDSNPEDDPFQVSMRLGDSHLHFLYGRDRTRKGSLLEPHLDDSKIWKLYEAAPDSDKKILLRDYFPSFMRTEQPL